MRCDFPGFGAIIEIQRSDAASLTSAFFPGTRDRDIGFVLVGGKAPLNAADNATGADFCLPADLARVRVEGVHPAGFLARKQQARAIAALDQNG